MDPEFMFAYTTSGELLILQMAATLLLMEAGCPKPKYAIGTSGGAIVSLIAARNDWDREAILETCESLDIGLLEMTPMRTFSFTSIAEKIVKSFVRDGDMNTIVACTAGSLEQCRTSKFITFFADDDWSLELKRNAKLSKPLAYKDVLSSASIPYIIESPNDLVDGVVGGTSPLRFIEESNLPGRLIYFTVYCPLDKLGPNVRFLERMTLSMSMMEIEIMRATYGPVEKTYTILEAALGDFLLISPSKKAMMVLYLDSRQKLTICNLSCEQIVKAYNDNCIKMIKIFHNS